jgi:hypothetical protein
MKRQGNGCLFCNAPRSAMVPAFGPGILACSLCEKADPRMDIKRWNALVKKMAD